MVSKSVIDWLRSIWAIPISVLNCSSSFNWCWCSSRLWMWSAMLDIWYISFSRSKRSFMVFVSL